jgi:tRNA dimethylallyltransferase
VENMVKMRYDFSLPAMSGIGYSQIGMFLRGELALPAAIQQIKFATHRFVRHQYAWFQLKDSRIRWFDMLNQSDSAIEVAAANFVRNGDQEESNSQ